MFNVRVRKAQWKRGEGLSSIVLLTFIVLKLTGVITWSWWWVLSPLWTNGVFLAVVLGAGLVLLVRTANKAEREIVETPYSTDEALS